MESILAFLPWLVIFMVLWVVLFVILRRSSRRTREEAAGLDWQNRIGRAAALVTTKYGVPGLKYAMDLNGYYGGPPRLPLTPPTASARKEIEDAFQDLKG